MRESLWEVAEGGSSGRVNFLRIQTEIILEAQQLLEQRMRLLKRSSPKRKEFCFPKAADSKRPFGRPRAVTVEQSVTYP